MKKKPIRKLTPAASRLIEEFAEAAKIHGWEEDQGHGLAVDRAAKAYDEAKLALEKYILKLQKPKPVRPQFHQYFGAKPWNPTL